MFDRRVHVVEAANGDKWINIDALLWVVASAASVCESQALAVGTPQAKSAAAVIAEYSRELRLALLRL